MPNDIFSDYQQIQNRIMGILQGNNLFRKALLMLGLVTTIGSLVFLLVKVFMVVVVFLAGVVILSWAMHKTD